MNLTYGIALAALAGIMNGLFPLPMKANKEWAWENNWLPFSFLSLAIFPWLIAKLGIANLGAVYAHASGTDILSAMLCGALVYTGSLLFGISITKIGVALAFTLLIGSMNAVGVLVPRLLMHHTIFTSTGDKFIVVGVLLSIGSVVLSFLASRGKEKAQQKTETTASSRYTGTLLAIAGGVLSGMLPAGMSMPWAQRLSHLAIERGGGIPSQAGSAVLALVLLGGAIPNCGYCIYLMKVNKTYQNYRLHNRKKYWGLTLCMSVLYSASVGLWGVAISPALLGPFGPSVGWALFVGMIVITSTTAGVISGEWRDAIPSSIGQLTASVVSLLASMVAICYGNFIG
jgi:L-rhamnose-H+ transport protein